MDDGRECITGLFHPSQLCAGRQVGGMEAGDEMSAARPMHADVKTSVVVNACRMHDAGQQANLGCRAVFQPSVTLGSSVERSDMF